MFFIICRSEDIIFRSSGKMTSTEEIIYIVPLISEVYFGAKMSRSDVVIFCRTDILSHSSHIISNRDIMIIPGNELLNKFRTYVPSWVL